MRTLDAPLLTHYQGVELKPAYCVKVTQRDGTVLGFTEHDQDLVVSGVTYRAAVGCQVSSLRFASAIEDDRFVIEGLMLGLSYAVQEPSAIIGLLSHATIELIETRWDDTSRWRRVKLGRISQVTPKGLFYSLECEGLPSILLRNNLIETYNADCNADFGDARCGATPSTFPGTITSIPNEMQLVASAFGGPATAGYFNFGRITLNEATWHTNQIKSYDSGTKTFTLALPLPLLGNVPTVGGTFTAYQGCDRLYSTCRDTHNNLVNFRGFPFIRRKSTTSLTYNVVPGQGYVAGS